jgi:hypothetical protein
MLSSSGNRKNKKKTVREIAFPHMSCQFKVGYLSFWHLSALQNGLQYVPDSMYYLTFFKLLLLIPVPHTFGTDTADSNTACHSCTFAVYFFFFKSLSRSCQRWTYPTDLNAAAASGSLMSSQVWRHTNRLMGITRLSAQTRVVRYIDWCFPCARRPYFDIE